MLFITSNSIRTNTNLPNSSQKLADKQEIYCNTLCRMTESRLGFLFKIASGLPLDNETYTKLKSFYLMQCHELTKGYGLPAKQFSTEARCPHCCLEWTKDSYFEVNPVNLTKGQRRKIRRQNQAQTDQVSDASAINYELHKIEMVQTCTFCKKSASMLSTKPKRDYKKNIVPLQQKTVLEGSIQTKSQNKSKNKAKTKTNLPAAKSDKSNDFTDNFYTSALDIFSLKNDKNTLSSSIKPKSKVIKNNKKKKDKYAGLCQKAVLATAKLKQQKEETTKKSSDNKLNLFLKPSS